jgi:8-oxo-dGTP pyrophosphatase MutT (NUDIX family)
MSGERYKVQVHLYQREEISGRLKFLVMQRTPSKDSIWQPVTGNVEPDEQLEAAAVREVWEETGINRIHDLKRVWEFDFDKKGRRFHETVFCARVDDSEVRLSSEHADHRWCPGNEARAIMGFESNQEGLDRALACIRSGGSRKECE